MENVMCGVSHYSYYLPAENLLNRTRHGDYRKIYVLQSREQIEIRLEYSSRCIEPQIFIDGLHVGGFVTFYAWLARGVADGLG